jgi:fluoride ion exporter CrcB/FEX
MPFLPRWVPPVLALLVVTAAAPAADAATLCSANGFGAALRSAVVTLTAADFYDPYGEEMRTFVDTGSLGAVTAELVSARPREVVRSFTAAAARSRLSPYFGEDLKGINVTVRLYHSRIPPVVRLRLTQDCAKYLRNTFLYY